MSASSASATRLSCSTRAGNVVFEQALADLGLPEVVAHRATPGLVLAHGGAARGTSGLGSSEDRSSPRVSQGVAPILITPPPGYGPAQAAA